MEPAKAVTVPPVVATQPQVAPPSKTEVIPTPTLKQRVALAGLQIPALWLAMCFTPLDKVYWFWRKYRVAEVYIDPNNTVDLMAGHVVQFFIGEKPLVGAIAQSVLIATRILDTVKAQNSFWKACYRWKDAFLGRALELQKPTWIRDVKTSLLSPSTIIWWKSVVQNVAFRIKLLAIQTFLIFRNLFLLCMKMIDVQKTLYLSEANQDESWRELFVNLGKLMKEVSRLIKNEEMIQHSLRNNKRLFENILAGPGKIFSVDGLMEVVSDGLQKAKKICQVYDAFDIKKSEAGILIADVALGLLKKPFLGFIEMVDRDPPEWLKLNDQPKEIYEVLSIRDPKTIPIPIESITVIPPSS